jgi:hypothetical protein
MYRVLSFKIALDEINGDEDIFCPVVALSLIVPLLHFRYRTPKRIIRSAWLSVGIGTSLGEEDNGGRNITGRFAYRT